MFSVNAVNAQSGYWLLPRKPSCAKTFSDTTTIANQRAHDRAAPADAAHGQQHAPDDHHPTPGRQVDGQESALVTTKYSSSKRAIKP